MSRSDSIDPRPPRQAGDATAEEARLDQAMRRADELLVSSLKGDDRRRLRRNLILFSLGGLVMVAGLCAMIVTFAIPTDAGSAAAKPQDGSQAAPGGDPEKAAQLSAQGWQLWQAQNFKEAIPKFDEAVKLDPKNTGAWNGLGWASFNSGNYGPAEEAFQNCIKLEPKHPAALNGLGQLALAQRKYNEAERYLLKAAPEASAAWYGLTRLYLLEGKYDDAAKWAKKAVAAGGSDPTASEMLKAAKAKCLPDDLRRQIEPPEMANNVGRAWRLMNQGRREEAKATFESILAKAPKDASALNGLGWLYLFGGDADAAKPYFEKALAAEPLAAGAMNGLARCLNAQGDTDGAIKIWQEMVAKIPGAHAGTSGLADAYLEKEEFQKAVPLLEQLAKAEPTNEEIKQKLARAKAGGAK